MMAADGIFLAALAVMTGCTLYFAPRIGRFIEPAIRPLGLDWKIGIGLVSSFAARDAS